MCTCTCMYEPHIPIRMYCTCAVYSIFFKLSSCLFPPAKCIDHYTVLRMKWFDDTADSKPEIDPRLENVVNRMFERCFDEHKFQQAAGIALETRRIDLLERAIQESVRAHVNNRTSVVFE